MKLIVGLGNPGRLYAHSRHNAGFYIVDALAKAQGISFKEEKETFCLNGKGRIQGQAVILSKPLTYMNLSGMAVSALIRRYRIDLDNLLVICDDLDLEFGRLKIRPSGSSGGHRGLDSIIRALGSQDFSRLRIGIGRKVLAQDTASYVLSAFTREQKHKLQEIIPRASSCCQMWVRGRIKEAMNIFNRKAQDK